MKKQAKWNIPHAVQIVGVGAATGLFAGLVVTLFNAVTALAEQFSRGYYAFFRDNPAFIPLLFLALLLGAVIIGGAVRFLPVIRGSGIPQTEGAARGLMRFKWYEALTGMFAAALFTIFMGLSAGSEGPSIMIGGACGGGASDLFRRNATVRRYQVTGGACAGLAVAFNAPFTGMAFAFEEAHKRFTPEVFICSFSSVVVGVLVRNLLRPLMGLSVGATFSGYSFLGVDGGDPVFLLYVLFAAVIVSLLGVGFYYAVLLSKKFFKKLTFFRGMGKMVIPFLLAGAFGLVSVYAMGGGHAFIEAMADMKGLERIFSSPLFLTLLLIVLFKFITTVVNMGAGVPCGAFVPMLAIGAGMGGLLSLACVRMGMDPAYTGALIMICMATFFTAVVRAPITGIIMTVELTWSFVFLLPVICAVAVGYLTAMVFRTQPIYDKLLDDILAGEKSAPKERIVVRVRVTEESLAAGRVVRDVLWPVGARIVLLERAGESFPPDGNTALLAGDVLVVAVETADAGEFKTLLATTAGEVLGSPASTEPPASSEPPAPPECGADGKASSQKE